MAKARSVYMRFSNRPSCQFQYPACVISVLYCFLAQTSTIYYLGTTSIYGKMFITRLLQSTTVCLLLFFNQLQHSL